MKMFIALAVISTLCFVMLSWIESSATSRHFVFWQGKTYQDSTSHSQQHKTQKKSGNKHTTKKSHTDTSNLRRNNVTDTTNNGTDKRDMNQIH